MTVRINFLILDSKSSSFWILKDLMSFISRAMCYLVLGLNWANLLECFVIIMLPGVPELLLGLYKMAAPFLLGDCENVQRKSLWLGKICFVIQKALLLASVGVFPRDSLNYWWLNSHYFMEVELLRGTSGNFSLLIDSTQHLPHSSVLCAKSLSQIWLFVTPRSVARQTPLSTAILQARILEWVAMPSSRGSSWLRDRTHVS